MKIHFKKPILNQIQEAISDAEKKGVEIDHFHLTQKEAQELRAALGDAPSILPIKACSILGVPCVVDQPVPCDLKEFERDLDEMLGRIPADLFGKA